MLSGTGGDGSVGLPRVKELGGVTLAQDPTEAEFGEMPKKVIATGFVDQVLPAAQMGNWLVNFQQRKIKQAQTNNTRPEILSDELTAEEIAPPNPHILSQILNVLRQRTGHNFAQYKLPTLNRRVERRMQINELADFKAYLDFIQTHPTEAEALLRDLLISVTNFFRDRKVWDFVEYNVIPALFVDKENSTSNSSIRVWVAGCATGEEAYTLAILLHEYAARLNYPVKIQIFASDLDEASIAIAREGIYLETIALDVSADRLKKSFGRIGGYYRVNKEIRDSILFARHNILSDPPFSRLDLVSCRNLMIYLNREAQGHLLSLFHFALKPDRFLLLGSSETAEGAADLFSDLSKKNHVYTRRTQLLYIYPLPEVKTNVVTAITSGGRADLQQTSQALQVNQPEHPFTKTLIPSELHQNILELYAAPSVVINEHFGIVHLSKRAGRYLEINGGEFTNNLI